MSSLPAAGVDLPDAALPEAIAAECLVPAARKAVPIAFPVSARHGFAWYEFDLNYGVIWTLGKLGLAKRINLARRLVEKADQRATGR